MSAAAPPPETSVDGTPGRHVRASLLALAALLSGLAGLASWQAIVGGTGGIGDVMPWLAGLAGSALLVLAWLGHALFGRSACELRAAAARLSAAQQLALAHQQRLIVAMHESRARVDQAATLALLVGQRLQQRAA
ncbi:MAG: hypothetical protein ABIR94_03205, partial [Rubrivivax sp.]